MSEIEIGQTYGRWKVEKALGLNRSKNPIYACVCQCDAKTEKTLSHTVLVNLRKRSCGCTRGTKTQIHKGQTFSRLTVLRRTLPDKWGRGRFECICSCPEKNVVIVGHTRLQQGDTRSCGCLHRENAQKMHKSITAESRTRGIETKRRMRMEMELDVKIGATYGRWFVVGLHGLNRVGAQTYDCTCSCAEKTLCVLTVKDLVKRNKVSCGCVEKQRAAAARLRIESAEIAQDLPNDSIGRRLEKTRARLLDLQTPVTESCNGFSPEHLNEMRLEAITIHQQALTNPDNGSYFAIGSRI